MSQRRRAFKLATECHTIVRTVHAFFAPFFIYLFIYFIVSQYMYVHGLEDGTYGTYVRTRATTPDRALQVCLAAAAAAAAAQTVDVDDEATHCTDDMQQYTHFG